MIINVEHNRVAIECSALEAMELIGEISKAVSAVIEFGISRSTNGMAASERTDDAAIEFKPSAFQVTVRKPGY